jgi:phage tail-like protein
MPSLHAANSPANRDLLFGQLNFEVKVSTLDTLIGFFTQVQGLSAQLDVLEYPEGGRNDMVHKLPSRIKQSNVTLKVGLTREGALLTWFQASVLQGQPTDMSITLLDSLNNPQRSWSFAQAYPVKWSASDFNAGGTEIMTETLEVAHQGMKAVPVSGGGAV